LSENVEEKRWAMVASALSLAFESLMNLDLQYLASMDKGATLNQISNLNERINRTFSLVKYLPFKVENNPGGISEEKFLIEEDKLQEFNEAVEDFFMLHDLKKSLNPDEVEGTEDLFYYKVIVPKYENKVNEMLRKNVGNVTWEEINHDTYSLREYLLKKIRKLGYHLSGQVELALVQTLPRDQLERITRSLATRRKAEWEG